MEHDSLALYVASYDDENAANDDFRASRMLARPAVQKSADQINDSFGS